MPTRKKQSPRPAGQHRRAVAAEQDLFRLCPQEAATWLCSRARPIAVLDAIFLEQAPPGPAYAVPAPQPEPERKGPPTPEEVVKRVITDAVVRDAAASKGKLRVEVAHFDLDEARRQVIVKGGCEVTAALGAVAAAHLDPAEVNRTLALMKL